MRRHPRHHRGQSLVEFALILPIFLVVLLGLFDLGRAVFYHSTISNAAREAVRLAIVDQNPPAIRQRAVDEAGGVMPITTADVTVRFLGPTLQASGHTCNATPSQGCIVEVTVDHNFTPATPFVGALALQAVTQQPIENQFVSP
jgi:Flp pilus assembly protein TadG